ncbi:unnamed protein product, partial [Nesidiocoris tenuis]
ASRRGLPNNDCHRGYAGPPACALLGSRVALHRSGVHEEAAETLQDDWKHC